MVTNVLENIEVFMTDNPHYFGILFFLFGIVLLLSAIYDAHWLFGDVSGSTYNLDKIDGWVNMFGRKTARVITGIMSVVIMIAGIVWFCIYAFYL